MTDWYIAPAAPRGARARGRGDGARRRFRRHRARTRRPRGDPSSHSVRRVPPLPARPRDPVRAVSRHATGPWRVRRARAGHARSWSRSCSSCPTGSTPVTATFIEPLACVLRAQDRAGLRAGDSLLVVGAGVNGVLQIAAAHARGVEVVWVREPRPERLELAEAWGAEHHGNELVDVAIACTPKPEAIEAAAEAVAPGGTLCFYAPPAPDAPPRLDATALYLREITVTASYSAGPGDMRAALELIAERPHRPPRARLAPAAARGDRTRARSAAPGGRAEGRGGAVRAALLFGTEDLRVEEVPEPEGEVIVEVRRGHHMRHRRQDVAPRAPRARAVSVRVRPRDRRRPHRHRRARARVRLGRVRRRAARAEPAARRSAVTPTWVLGGFAERIAAPEAALHRIPDGLPAPAAAMAEPLAAAVHAVDRGSDATDVGVLGGGPMGLMLTSLLVAQGRSVTVADPHPERRAQAAELGATPADELRQHDLVFEAVGRPETWRAAAAAAAPGGRRGTRRRLPGRDRDHPADRPAPLRGARASRRRSTIRLTTSTERSPCSRPRMPCGGRCSGRRSRSSSFPPRSASPNGGPAKKWVVDPRG